MGSSPPVRGARQQSGAHRQSIGLIPARAGSTHLKHVFSAALVAHPRPCGEHHYPPTTRQVEKGSSPPVRGARAGAVAADCPPGLIPARAGSTTGWLGVAHGLGAHPRPCGEHFSMACFRASGEGSSPPVRGALGYLSQWEDEHGLIPARAGSTCVVGHSMS